ncbi:hypothetical protein [Nocardia stercoris]|uniref:Tetratricopeptide repeat protein n=1 Tax=Nocardia stercoris TaxID=2483361 RepID=A0A3M2L949_9NOCA|nr:hypothetical protein [Nocardia stercoris]RMI33934.1 hypothetical protein EBN03_05560 [Nocardia stercoris]
MTAVSATSGQDPTTVDPIMVAISDAIVAGRRGELEQARHRLAELWDEVGAEGDPLHRCTIGHYLADLFGDDPAEALNWDVRALEAADGLTDERTQRHHETLSVAGFYPSLHLNVADNFRRIGSFAAAHRHLTAARERLAALSADNYAHTVATGIENVAAALALGSTDRLPSH